MIQTNRVGTLTVTYFPPKITEILSDQLSQCVTCYKLF
ncbi:hypothetical protein AVEN_184396-1, partial [Araneus ventricosus]